MKEKAYKLAKEWANNPYFDQADRDSIQELIDTDQENEIIESFYQDLEFGTGGLRSIIGIGSNRMNKYNVRKATQAMCNIVLKQKKPTLKAAISHDNRRFSKEFAREVASVFAANGIKAFIYPELTPTPMLSYAVRHYNADCGVMLTASHNPKQYNGFKAYWSDGAQVTPPHDSEIIAAYSNITRWEEIKTMDFDSALTKNLVEWIPNSVNENFYKIIEEGVQNKSMCKEQGDKVHFIYTPLHGCGYIPCKTISERLGFSNFEVVESQAVFDSEFSTLKSTPNPEDPEALELAVALMIEANADIAYGTDPDCDRLGVVVNNKGVPVYLNGNQIGVLMLEYICKQKIQHNSMPKHPLVIKSIVTSPLQATIAKAYGSDIIDTLTGFKWMAHAWRELQENGTQYEFLFASEESFGYMPHDKVRDKDAVTAIALMNELTLYHKLEGRNLLDALDFIYEEHGYAQESLIALTFEGLSGKEKIQKIMEYFRVQPELSIAGQKTKIFTDYKSLEKMTISTKLIEKVDMYSSNVLGFEFESGDFLYLRPSGTEPKIKFYTMVQAKDGDLTQKKAYAAEKIIMIEKEIHDIINKVTQ